MSLLLNMLSRLVITFLPRSELEEINYKLISWLQSPSTVILELKKIKSDTVSTVSQSICHEVMGPDAVILVFWILSFKSAFSLFFHPHQEVLHFLPLDWCILQIWGCWYFSLQSWFQLVSHSAWHFMWCTLDISLTSRGTIYSLDILLSQFWTSPFFHIQF